MRSLRCVEPDARLAITSAEFDWRTIERNTLRTLLIILAGFLALGVCYGLAKFFADASVRSIRIATAVFVVIWFLVAAANLWVGVTQAGYAFREELPFFLLILLLPAATAIFVKWKFY